MRFGTMEAFGVAALDSELSAMDAEEQSTIRKVLTLRPTSRGKIIGHDDSVRQVLGTIDRVARSACTVLVTGESGTGKELVVAALHDASTRRDGPLVTINCGAIPVDLVESELFGHARGAFTGAQQTRKGHVAMAEGGTLFLDEIGELPMSVQVKLLRLLQQREYTPLGESRAIKCDVRIVAATNRDLEAEVAAGRFREDLFYRLNVIHLHLPPLRERRGDARLLASHFFRSAAAASGRDDLRGLSDAALAAIEAHPWPGNIRALENAVERGVLLARGPWVEAEDIIGRGHVRRAIVEAPATSMTTSVDARREPEVSDSGAVRKAIPFVPPVDDSARSAFAAIPPPTTIPEPRAAVPTVNLPTGPSGPQARPSDPMFPRVLPDRGVDLFSAVESYQNNLIRQALVRTGGNKNRAAQLLGVNRTTLVEMIRRRGL
jgi:sigma-54 dependent transcriptional regulator, flagellar regulatory protein